MKALLENVSYLADVKILRNVPFIRVPVMNNNQYHDLNRSGLYERKVKNVLIGLLCFGLFFIGPHFSASGKIVSGLRSVYGAPGDDTPSESARSDFSDQYDQDGDGEVDAPDDTPSEDDIADFADEYDQDGDGEIDELDEAVDEDEPDPDQSDVEEQDDRDDLDDRDDERDGDETDEPDDDSGDTRDDRDGRNDVDEGERPDFTSSGNNTGSGGSTPGLKNRLGEMVDLSPLSEQEEKSLIGNW